MNIYVVARSSESAEEFFKRHSFCKKNIRILLGEKSLFSVINNIIKTETAPALFVHDDIYFSKIFLDNAKKAIENLNDNYKSWGIVGNAGYACCSLGFNSSKIVRYIADPHGGPNLSGKIIPAETIDGNTILLNVPLLKEKNVYLPEISGFHCYDIILSIESIIKGLGVYIVPYLLCYHKSGGSQKGFDLALSNPQIVEYFSKTLKNLYIDSINGRILNNKPNGKYDLPLLALKASQKVNPISVSIVIRTTFERKELLFRAVQSVKSFISNSGNSSIYNCFIFSSFLVDSDNYLGIPIKCFHFSGEDSRFFLVKKAFSFLKSDYIWFIDDDDWMFPNEAKLLTSTLLSAPISSTFFVGSQHFIEESLCGSWLGNSRVYPDRYFCPKQFYLSPHGQNQIPFSGMIFPRNKLSKLLEKCDDYSITYYEDYLVELLDIFSEEFFPVIIDKLFIGISIRKSGNTVTENDRTKWWCSEAAVLYYACMNNGILFSHPSSSSFVNNNQLLSSNNCSEIKKIAFFIKKYSKIKYLYYKLRYLMSPKSKREKVMLKMYFYKDLINKSKEMLK